MSYLPTHSGEIWGSAAQKAAVKKAAEASARKRRKNEQTEPEGKRPTLQSERVQARIDSYKAKLAQPDPSRDGRGHHYLAKAMKASYVELRAAKSTEATREMNQRLAAEKAAKTPEQLAKEKAVETLRGQESLLAEYRKVIEQSPGSWAAKDAQDRIDRVRKAMADADTPPRPAAKRGLVAGKAVKVELQGGSVHSATIDTVYDTFYLVRLKDGTVINVDKEPQSLAHRILPARKPKPTGIR